MRIVCVREGRKDFHLGDVVDLPDPVENAPVTIDLNYFSHIDSERSQYVLESVGKNPDGSPKQPSNPNEDNSGTPNLRADANEDGGE